MSLDLDEPWPEPWNDVRTRFQKELHDIVAAPAEQKACRHEIDFVERKCMHCRKTVLDILYEIQQRPYAMPMSIQEEIVE